MIRYRFLLPQSGTAAGKVRVEAIKVEHGQDAIAIAVRARVAGNETLLKAHKVADIKDWWRGAFVAVGIAHMGG